jgi:hypothetical protein
MKSRNSVFALLLAFAFLWMGGCANIFEEMSEKDTDEAILYDAKKLIAEGKWDSGLTKISELSTDYQAKRDVKMLEASAYAGKCGLEPIQLAEDLENGTGGRLFEMLFTAMAGSTATNISDCITAETIVKSISTDANLRTASENLFMSFLALVKIGAILAFYGDDDPLDSTLDPSFTPCDPLAGKTELADADADEIVTGLAIFLTSIQGISNVSGLPTDDLQQVCTDLEAQDPGLNFCTKTDTASVTEPNRVAVRGLIEEDQAVGLGICALGTVACVVACVPGP